MAKSVTFANDVCDFILPNGGSGTVVFATYVAPFKVKFLSTLSTAAASGTEWATSGGYTATASGAVGGVSLAGLCGTPAAGASKANTGAITVTNAPLGNWVDNEIVDSTVGTNKRVAFKGTPSLAKSVNAGDTCTIATGALTAAES